MLQLVAKDAAEQNPTQRACWECCTAAWIFQDTLMVHSSNQLLFKNKQTNQPCSRVPHEAGFPFPYYEYKHCFLLGVGLKDECTKRILSWLCWLGK